MCVRIKLLIPLALLNLAVLALSLGLCIKDGACFPAGSIVPEYFRWRDWEKIAHIMVASISASAALVVAYITLLPSCTTDTKE